MPYSQNRKKARNRANRSVLETETSAHRVLQLCRLRQNRTRSTRGGGENDTGQTPRLTPQPEEPSNLYTKNVTLLTMQITQATQA